MWDPLTSSPAVWFSVPALIGTALFALKLGLLLFGGDADASAVDAGAGAGGVGAGGVASEVFSLGGVLAFLMGFGWGGLGGVLGLGWGVGASAGLGAATGLALGGVFVAAMRGMRGLNASGNIELASTAGAAGEVTLTVPAAGAGRGEVRLIVGGRERRCEAISAGAALPTRTRVRVSGVNADNTVTVERV